MCDDWALYQELFMSLCIFDMFYIQWHHLAKKDLWNEWISDVAQKRLTSAPEKTPY
jgi:hypothetical protein